MKVKGIVMLTAFAVGCALVATIGAQQRDLSKPTVELVSVIGCAGLGSTPSDWTLTSATEATVVESPFTSTQEVEDAGTKALGTDTYRLIGTAEFVSTEQLLSQGQRTEFTAEESVNATGQLSDGHKVVVKGLLILAEDEKRINVTSVQSLSDTCQ